MSEYRNNCWEIDSERVYDVIQNDLDDFRLFQEKIVEFLSSEKADM